MTKIDIYVDGACSGNPGPGGWAAVCKIGGKKMARTGHQIKATNNSMELLAVIEALNGLKEKNCNVTIHTDSAYICTCTAHDNAWLTQEGRANRELWMQYLQALTKGKHKVSFVKVKGHSGDEMNDCADRLAKSECKKARYKLAGIAI